MSNVISLGDRRLQKNPITDDDRIREALKGRLWYATLAEIEEAVIEAVRLSGGMQMNEALNKVERDLQTKHIEAAFDDVA